VARIAFFGAGYAGLVSGACLAELGHTVVIRDVVPERIEALRAGKMPFYEPGLGELVAKNSERLAFTLAMEEAVAGSEFLFVCVGTPPTPSGDADLSNVWSVIEALPQDLGPAVLVMKSTVPVGTGEKVRAALDARGLGHVGYASCPEFLAEGSAVRDFMESDRIVVGSFEDADGDGVEALHEPLGAPVVRMDVPSAEMVKLAANAYLATRISFINEIANVCELVGADVEQVARGMGLDRRIGTHYLRAGLGYGGSCLVGEETVLVRHDGRTCLVALEQLFQKLADDPDEVLVHPEGLEVLSWREGATVPEFMPVAFATRRRYEGEILEVKTKMGRRLRCTSDHPFITADADGRTRVKVAAELTVEDWLPLAQNAPTTSPGGPPELDVLAGVAAAGLGPSDVIVRPPREELDAVGVAGVRAAITPLGHPRGAAVRAHDITRAGALRLHELEAVGLSLEGAALGTARNGTYVPPSIRAEEAFWRIVGLYVAEGHCTIDGSRRRLRWSFHPDGELDLVDEVLTFWRSLGVKATVRHFPTTTAVVVSSRLLAAWWTNVLGLGRNCYEQRIPDRIWGEPEEHKRALLAGLWRGDGSWSFVGGGPSVVLEYGTVSRELADGIVRLLGDLGIVASLKIGRTARSTCDTFWVRVSGADQVESMLELVHARDRESIEASIARQSKRIAPTGFRRHHANAAWVRVTRTTSMPFAGSVYSLEVPGNHAFVTTGGLAVHNCFPKDMSFLKLLAGNSGYHFHLVTAVMEVNELQMRRPVAKLQKHLGPLRGKRIALLGLAFKPHTDDLREAPSRVLTSRLLAEGAEVVAWDPVVDATGALGGIELAGTVADAVRGADAAVVVTEWPELRDVPWVELRGTMRTPLVIDARNHLDAGALGAAGYAYEGMGRAASPFASLPETQESESVRKLVSE
jgi:UDPglucose 6-dehydrogenase